MTLKVHGSPYSTCNERVLLILHEKGVPYERITLDFEKAEQKAPEYLKLQPFGKVPVLEDDGFFVYESRAIVRYLAMKYAGQGTKLMPDPNDLKAYALFEQACSLEQSYFDGPTSSITHEKLYKGMMGNGPADEAILAQHVAALDATLAVYDGILAKQSYLAGEELTAADLNHLPYGRMARSVGYKELWDKYPNVKRWWKSLEERESWQKIIS